MIIRSSDAPAWQLTAAHLPLGTKLALSALRYVHLPKGIIVLLLALPLQDVLLLNTSSSTPSSVQEARSEAEPLAPPILSHVPFATFSERLALEELPQLWPRHIETSMQPSVPFLHSGARPCPVWLDDCCPDLHWRFVFEPHPLPIFMSFVHQEPQGPPPPLA